MTLNAAIYCRISSDPTGQRAGVGRQERDCHALVEENGWTLVRVYVDNDTSAFSGRARPEYTTMINDVRDGGIQVIVAWHPDRLTRAVREVEDLIDLADERGVRFATVQTGDLDLSTHSGRMHARMLGTLARYESEHRSTRVTRKLEDNAAAGRPHGRRSYGWDRLKGAGDHLERINPREAAVIRDAAAQVLAGHSLASIVKDLNARGVPAPSSGAWDRGKLRSLLLRERNAGRRVHRGSVVGRGLWEPILDDATFDRVATMLRDPGRRTSTGTAAKHLLSGVARCGVCEGPLRAARNRGVLSYRCATSACVSRRLEDVDAVVRESLLARLARPDVASLFPRPEQEALVAARAEHDRLLELREQAGADLVEGVVARDQFRELSLRLNASIASVEREIRRLATSTTFGDLSAAIADPYAAWEEWPAGRRRALISALMEVRLLPAGQGARTFDPRTVEIRWRT